MKNSIESMWKEGFLNEKSLVVPKINNLYNQKSQHLIDQMKRMFKNNLKAIVIMAAVLLIIHYFLAAIWQGVAASTLLLLTAWYSSNQMKSLQKVDQGLNSYEYLKAFDNWLKNTLSRSSKIMRFSYPLYFLIAASTLWSAWSAQEELIAEIAQEFPDLVFVGDVPLFAVIIVGVGTLLMGFFSERIYKWDVRLVYGRVIDKLENTIAEMEKLNN